MLEHGADVNAEEAWRGQTAVIWAAAQKQPAMIEAAARARRGPQRTLERQRLGPAGLGREAPRQYRPFGGLTALMYAAREGCVECARALVEGGADIDLAGSRNITPLIMALENMNFDTAAYLLEAGAAVDVWDWWGRTPLYMAVDLSTLPSGGRPDRLSTDATPAIALVERILERGANPNSQLKLLPPYRERGNDRGCDSMLVTGATPLLSAAKTFDTASMKAPDRARRAARSAERQRRDAADGRGRLWLARVRHPRLRPRHSALPDERRRAEVHRGAASARRGGRRHQRRDDRRRARQRPRSDGAVRRRVLGLERRHHVPRATRREDRRRRTAKVERPSTRRSGRAGGHERGASIQVFKDSAELLHKLCAEQSECALPTPAS